MMSQSRLLQSAKAIDLVNQIPDSVNLDDFVSNLAEQCFLNVEEAASFERLVKARDNEVAEEDTSESWIDVDQSPRALKILAMTIRVTKEGIANDESLLFLRGLIKQIASLLQYLKKPNIKLTQHMMEKIIEGGNTINWTFEIYEKIYPTGFNLAESGLHTFLTHLSLFVIGEATEYMTAAVQDERTELVGQILKQMRLPILQLYILRHLIHEVKAYMCRVSRSLMVESPTQGIVEFNVMNSLFSFIRLLECHILEMDTIQETDVIRLKLMGHSAASAFPAFPTISLVLRFLSTLAEEISKTKTT